MATGAPGPDTPALLVRAREPVGPPARWRLPHTALEAAGDRFTKMEAHAGETGAAVDHWQKQGAAP
ncbi:hypothetical protein AB0953_13805 [Streptomyces sp. NPDC046866]|uniref:hypothetical protein n=1 Tax=Streptomyces sp. NPDC046866 TaxID=3154921 RepID=UPI0034555884